MASITCQQMRQLEHDVFAGGVMPEQLMDIAGEGIARAILRRYPDAGTAIACIGSGNNGGDALVALRHLRDAGWSVGIRVLHKPTELGALPRKKWRALGNCPINDEITSSVKEQCLVLLDGLLGIGASGPLRAPLDELAQWMNDQRQNHGADVIAMDIPSGVNGDTGEPYPGAVVADLTLTIGVPKQGLFADQAVNYVGAIETVPLADLTVVEDGSATLTDVHSLHNFLPRRPHDFHKGDAGRVGVVAGSHGMLGAAVLCASGAVHSGAGLVTLFVGQDIYEQITAMLPPEVMVKVIKDFTEVAESTLDALAIGPGLGVVDTSFFNLLEEFQKPTVLDADALNRLAEVGVEKYLRGNMLLTPHPGEMARLFPEGNQMIRAESVKAFADKYSGSTVLLKGARTLITKEGSPVFINGSGNAGMATGGQGDLLTGVIAGLLAQGLENTAAARMGAWLCGRAAELAISHGGLSQQTLTPSDVCQWLGAAFRELK